MKKMANKRERRSMIELKVFMKPPLQMHLRLQVFIRKDTLQKLTKMYNT
jgi:hypothetical protein